MIYLGISQQRKRNLSINLINISQFCRYILYLSKQSFSVFLNPYEIDFFVKLLLHCLFVVSIILFCFAQIHVIFIHIPKNAGESIEKTLGMYRGNPEETLWGVVDNRIVLQHLSAERLRDNYIDEFIRGLKGRHRILRLQQLLLQLILGLLRLGRLFGLLDRKQLEVLLVYPRSHPSQHPGQH